MATTLITDNLAFNWDSEDYTEGSTTWTDRVGSKTITIYNGAEKGDDGLEFTSSNYFYSENLSIGVSYPLTFEWIGRLDSFNTGHMWGLGSTSGSWSYGVNMYSKATNCIIDNGATQTGITSTGLLHLVVVFSSSTAWTIYYTQGGSISGTPSSKSGTSSLSSYNKNYLFNNEGTNRLVGAIDKMRIWTTAMSSTEVATLFTEVSTDPPVITVETPDKTRISDESGFDECTCYFTSDVDLSEWEARATLSGATTGRGVGLLVESGTTLSAGEQGTVSVLDEELTSGDGDYIVTVYGCGTNGVWSE